jgi:hypothetical protein
MSPRACKSIASALGISLVAACQKAPIETAPLVAVQELVRAQGKLIVHRDITAWYRICPQGSVGTEGIIVIWPASVELTIDLRSAVVSHAEGGNLVVSAAWPDVTSVHVPEGLSDTMLSPVDFDLKKQQDSAAQHSRQLSALGSFLAAQYFVRSSITRNSAAQQLRQSLSASLGNTQHVGDRFQIQITPTPRSSASLPEVQLCPDSFLLVNGSPILHSQGDKIELVTDDLHFPILDRPARPRENLTAGDTGLLGTAYLLPNFTEPSEARALKKIANGTRAAPREFPYAVALTVRRKAANGEFSYKEYCGGALVKRDVVLTAGHCPVAMGHWAVIGAVDLTDINHPGVEIIPLLPNENYAPGYGGAAKYDADLQLVPLQFASNAQPIRPSTDSVSAGDRLTAIGWGLTESGLPAQSLMKTSLTVNTIDACTSYYAQYIKDSPHDWGITNHMICAGGGAVGTCDGDSGGPLLLGHSIHATVSFADSCTKNKEAPTLFTRLADFLDFLK